MYLFDVSTSVHTGAPDDPFQRAAAILVPAVNEIREEALLLPQRHRVGTIGAASLMQEPLCDIRAEVPTIFRTVDTSGVTKELLGCDQRLRAAKPEKATDIRGALHFSALTLQGSRQAVRGIVLVSDLEEYIPKGRVAATPDLKGFCVAVYTVMTPVGASRPDSLRRLEGEWKQQLGEWGAQQVHVQSVLGFEPGELATFFRGCRPPR